MRVNEDHLAGCGSRVLERSAFRLPSAWTSINRVPTQPVDMKSQHDVSFVPLSLDRAVCKRVHCSAVHKLPCSI